MKINTQRLKRRWRWYAAYVLIFILSFALFYVYDRAQDQSTEHMLEDIHRSAMSHADTVVTSITDKDEVPAFNQADLNRENHK